MPSVNDAIRPNFLRASPDKYPAKKPYDRWVGIPEFMASCTCDPNLVRKSVDRYSPLLLSFINSGNMEEKLID